MSRSSYKSAARKRGRGYWTPKRIARVLAYAQEHLHRETLEHFHISGSMLAEWKNANGSRPKAAPAERTGRQLYLLAKKLEQALIEHRKAGAPPSDVESYAFFLLREILK